MKDYLAGVKIAHAQKTYEQHMYALHAFLRFLASDPAAPKSEDLRVFSRDTLTKHYAWLRRPETTRHGKPDSRPRSLNTTRKMVEIVEGFWAWCADDERYEDKTPRPKRIEMKGDAEHPTQAPTWEQMDACIAHTFGWYRWPTLWMRMTGLRVSQVMLLIPADLNLARGTLRFRGELGKTKAERAGRMITLAPTFVALLHRLVDAGLFPLDREWLLPSGRNKGERERQMRAERVALAWRKAGVPDEVWHTPRRAQPDHAFRKGFESNLKRAGADTEAVEYLVGHKMAGVRSAYVDPTFLPIVQAVARVPPLSPAAEAHLFRPYNRSAE